MEYFTINKKGEDLAIHFFNRGWSIYSSRNKPNLLEKLDVKPVEFVNKINSLFTKYRITIPNNFPKYSDSNRKIFDKKVDDFPIYDFLICLHCCILIEDEFGIDTSKILRWELIKPNSNRGIYHACSMAVITFNYLKKKYSVSIPRENKNELNPDLIIDNLRCEVKTIQEVDWERDVNPDTGLGKKRTRGPDLCYDIGKFIGKVDSGYKGILQADVILADLTFKSFGEISRDFRGFGLGDKLQYGLPEPKKNRIIFFSRHYLDCVGYYIDFEPRLWNLIEIASGFGYQKAVLSFSIPADGKPHEIKIPEPPED